jgi:hypothetical protein
MEKQAYLKPVDTRKQAKEKASKLECKNQQDAEPLLAPTGESIT